MGSWEHGAALLTVVYSSENRASLPALVESHLLPIHILLKKDRLLADDEEAGLPAEEDKGFLDATVAAIKKTEMKNCGYCLAIEDSKRRSRHGLRQSHNDDENVSYAQPTEQRLTLHFLVGHDQLQPSQARGRLTGPLCLHTLIVFRIGGT